MVRCHTETFIRVCICVCHRCGCHELCSYHGSWDTFVYMSLVGSCVIVWKWLCHLVNIPINTTTYDKRNRRSYSCALRLIRFLNRIYERIVHGDFWYWSVSRLICGRQSFGKHEFACEIWHQKLSFFNSFATRLQFCKQVVNELVFLATHLQLVCNFANEL